MSDVEICDKNYRYLKIGDIWQDGDIYGDSDSYVFVIGSRNTGIEAGEKVTKEMMHFKPRRKVK